MQSKKEEFMAEIEAYGEETYPKSFGLYEEYSRKNIAETIRTRRESFAKANINERRDMAAEVEGEVKSFCSWLEETKGLQPSVARYCSVGLKSLLLGLPMGVQIACLFGEILNVQTE